MQKRFTVRKYPQNQSYWCVWDREENRVVGHIRASKFDVTDQCKWFNKRNKGVA